MFIKTLEEPFNHLGMKVGSQHTRCPTGTHKNTSSTACQRNDQQHIVWHCHACGESGSIVDAWAHHYGKTPVEAMKELESIYSSDSYEAPVIFTKPDDDIEDLYPTQESVPPIPGDIGFRSKDGDILRIETATKVWVQPYEDEDENVWACAVARWDVGENKVIRQLHYDSKEWHITASPHKRRPLYKWNELYSADMIIVVEGEKCMDVAQEACDKARALYGESFPLVVVTTTIGGSAAVKKAILEPLTKKTTILLRDNDTPGLKMMKYIKDFISNPATVRIINLASENDHSGFDVADWLEAGGDIREIIVMQGEQSEEDAPAQVVTYEPRDLIVRARGLMRGVINEEVDKLFQDIAQSNINPLWKGQILDEIKKSLDVSKGAVTAMMKEVEEKNKEQEIFDWPDLVARKTFNEVYGKRLIFRGREFWKYNGKCWEREEVPFVAQNILNTAMRSVPDNKRDAELIMRKAERILTALAAVNGDYLGLNLEPKQIINVQNGELHVNKKTGEVKLRPHSPDSRLTYCLDVTYDPSAQCPEYDEMIRRVAMGDEDWVRHFEEVAGYFIQPHRNFKNFFMFYGKKGNNGKTFIKDLICSLIGHSAVFSVKFKDFGKGTHDTASLVGKMMIVDDDLEKGVKLNDGLIKQLSEQKMMSANPKNRDVYNFISYAGILICTNHFPSTGDLTKAMVDRAMIIPFNAFFDKKNVDYGLFERLKTNELPGILNRWLAGLARLRMRNDWIHPESCIKARNEWLMSTSNMFLFRTTNIQDTMVEGAGVYAKDLRDRYKVWAQDMSVADRYVPSLRAMRSSFEELGYITEGASNNKGGWRILGVELMPYDSE